MPRGRSSRSSSSSSRSSYGSRNNSSSRSPQPQQRQQTQPQQTFQQQVPAQRPGGMMSGIGSTIMTGMAFGAGSEIAHQAVRGIIGGGHNNGGSPHEVPQQEVKQVEQVQQNQHQQVNPCMTYNNKFIDCLKQNGNDISSCQNFFDDLKICEKNMI